TGAMTGNLLGAMFGLAAIPTEWVDGLKAYHLVETVALDLSEEFADGRYQPRADRERYPSCCQELCKSHPGRRFKSGGSFLR
ncbi:MAG: hypothetical protein ACRDX8_12860, partial [Acidimicrobiales bacterium]